MYNCSFRICSSVATALNTKGIESCLGLLHVNALDVGREEDIALYINLKLMSYRKCCVIYWSTCAILGSNRRTILCTISCTRWFKI
jgi:predicted nucleic acid-binding Zn finger protein